jgi:hypothetical protein
MTLNQEQALEVIAKSLSRIAENHEKEVIATVKEKAELEKLWQAAQSAMGALGPFIAQQMMGGGYRTP